MARDTHEHELTDMERVILDTLWNVKRYLFDHPKSGIFDKPTPGDLVLCSTNWRHKWGLAIYVEPLPDSYGGAVLRQLGTGKLLNMYTESFSVFQPLSWETLICGEQRIYLRKLREAFRRYANGSKRNILAEGMEEDPFNFEFYHRFAEAEFKEGYVFVSVYQRLSNGEPYTLTLPFRPKASVVSIQRDMVAAGYGRKEMFKAACEEVRE